MDYYLKAADESTLWAKLIEANVAQEISVKNMEGEVVETRPVASKGYSLDVIGVIYTKTGNKIARNYGEGTAEVLFDEMVALPGFHANLRGDLTSEQKATLESIMIEAPKTPSRVWF